MATFKLLKSYEVRLKFELFLYQLVGFLPESQPYLAFLIFRLCGFVVSSAYVIQTYDMLVELLISTTSTQLVKPPAQTPEWQVL